MSRRRSGLIATALVCAACSHPASQFEDRLDRPNQAEIQVAELALARGDWQRARRAFEEILERNPAEPRALLGSAQANLSGGRGEAALARFAAYRSDDNAWNKVEQWQYCRALALATDQTLSSRKNAPRALELARLLESEKCADPRTSDLILLSLLALADEARQAGRDERALEVYLSLISPESGHFAQSGVPGSAARDNRQGRLDPKLAPAARARAYLAAAELLIAAQRRADALRVLSRGLDELPGDRELVQRMVDVLADGSPTETPAELQSAPAD